MHMSTPCPRWVRSGPGKAGECVGESFSTFMKSNDFSRQIAETLARKRAQHSNQLWHALWLCWSTVPVADKMKTKEIQWVTVVLNKCKWISISSGRWAQLALNLIIKHHKADYYKFYHGSPQAKKPLNFTSLLLIITFVNLSSGAILLYWFLLKY